jgi:biopolymer transport protein ExbB/TolQ
MKTSPSAGTIPRPRSITWAAFLVGVPLAALLLLPLRFGPAAEWHFARYVKHTVECVEVLLFCCALAALAAKFVFSLAERGACNAGLVPPWDGRPVLVGTAPELLAALRQRPRWQQDTYLGRRIAAILDFIRQRRSTDELDDHLRCLADNDVLALENSYTLTRFITWAIPILGFLGTVLGITEAIANVSPELLEKNLSSVTNGLALAFDATALGLALTMVTMFCSFLVERREQAVLEAVDHVVERDLAHRFQRGGAELTPMLDALRGHAQVVLDAVGQLVHRQTELWASALAEGQQRAAQTHKDHEAQLTRAMSSALEQTLHAHQQRLAALELKAIDQGVGWVEQIATLAAAVRDTGREQQAMLGRVAEQVAAQAALLGRLQEGEHHLVQLQSSLRDNLSAVAAVGTFDQAIHSLTAAIHLLTARTGVVGEGGVLPFGPPRGTTGKAA